MMEQRRWKFLNYSECKAFVQSLVKNDAMEVKDEWLAEMEKFIRGNLVSIHHHPGDPRFFKKVKRRRKRCCWREGSNFCNTPELAPFKCKECPDYPKKGGEANDEAQSTGAPGDQ